MSYASFLLDPYVRAVILATALGFMVLEYALGRLAHRESHDWRESAASFGVALGKNLVRGLEAGIVAIPFAFFYQHRLFDFDQTSLPALAMLFLGSEFLYYWQHRASHRIRWMWATHAVHHSTTRLNLTAAIRLGLTGNISGNFLFFLPLAWFGFHPFAIVGMLGINLLYQFFIHTELAPRLGPLEWVLNTPAHHRVHHASNASCLDKNYGGMLIVFDLLFGTFANAPAQEPLRYGLVGGEPSFNPVRIALGEWIAMLRDTSKAQGPRAKLRTLFGPPGA
jgi:sterol desaturase/sphingolipid hydroxylase (fatty acid hydroxylase superfamily)